MKYWGSKGLGQASNQAATVSSHDRWFCFKLGFWFMAIGETYHHPPAQLPTCIISFHQLSCLQENATGLHMLVSTWNCLNKAGFLIYSLTIATSDVSRKAGIWGHLGGRWSSVLVRINIWYQIWQFFTLLSINYNNTAHWELEQVVTEAEVRHDIWL